VEELPNLWNFNPIVLQLHVRYNLVAPWTRLGVGICRTMLDSFSIDWKRQLDHTPVPSSFCPSQWLLRSRLRKPTVLGGWAYVVLYSIYSSRGAAATSGARTATPDPSYPTIVPLATPIVSPNSDFSTPIFPLSLRLFCICLLAVLKVLWS